MGFKDLAKQAIHENGGRITAQREQILDLLEQSNDYMEAEQLYHLAQTRDTSISLTTVYRTLSALEDAGLIQPQYLSQEHDRKYYRVATVKKQFHFTCTRCQHVVPFQIDVTPILKKAIEAQLHVDVSSMCICVEGVCEACHQENEIMTLDQLTTNQAATVRRIAGTGAVRRRLMDMGLVKGIAIEMVKAAPMGDPVEYLVRGYHLSLRKSEAQLVEIELC